jgi:hypothetical protein
MAEEKYLKTENQKSIILFTLLNVAILLALRNYGSDFWEELRQHVLDLKDRGSLFQLALPVIIWITVGFLPSYWKEVLVFKRFRNPLPGCRAFTVHAKADDRIDIKKLEAELGPLPQEPKDQNSLWYSLFKQVRTELTVREEFKRYLLTRDVTGVSALFFVFGSITLVALIVPMKNLGIYAAVTVAELIVFSIVAQNSGKRLVCDALAAYLNRAKSKKSTEAKKSTKDVKG